MPGRRASEAGWSPGQEDGDAENVLKAVSKGRGQRRVEAEALGHHGNRCSANPERFTETNMEMATTKAKAGRVP